MSIQAWWVPVILPCILICFYLPVVRDSSPALQSSWCVTRPEGCSDPASPQGSPHLLTRSSSAGDRGSSDRSLYLVSLVPSCLPSSQLDRTGLGRYLLPAGTVPRCPVSPPLRAGRLTRSPCPSSPANGRLLFSRDWCWDSEQRYSTVRLLPAIVRLRGPTPTPSCDCIQEREISIYYFFYCEGYKRESIIT